MTLLIFLSGAGYVAALIWSWEISRSLRGWKRTVGLYETRIREQSDLLTRHRFSYRDEAGRTKFFNGWSIAFVDLRVGDEVTVLVSPDGEQAKVARWSFLYAQPLSVALLGTLFLLIGGADAVIS